MQTAVTIRIVSYGGYAAADALVAMRVEFGQTLARFFLIFLLMHTGLTYVFTRRIVRRQWLALTLTVYASVVLSAVNRAMF